MSDDDDWFERALRDPESSDGAGQAEETADVEDAESPADDGVDPDADGTAEGDGSPGSDGTGDRSDGEGDAGGLFEDDFATALGESGGGEFEGGADDFGGGEDFGMGGEGFGGGDEAFGMGGGEEFGFGGGGAAGPELDEEDFESELPRLDLGIEGLDDMIRGGVPERSLMTAIGSAGTGKTTFGLQFLNHGLEQGERGVYITLEESRQRIIDSATEKGWDFDEYASSGQLAIIDIDPVEMANSLTSIQSELPELVQEFGAERLVLDSVSLLELMYEDRAKRRNEVYDFTRALKESGVTTLLTSEASEGNPYASRHGIVEYLTDAVFVLQYVRPSDFRETRLAVEIQKIRDASHSREMKPYEITDDGLNVYRQANIF